MVQWLKNVTAAAWVTAEVWVQSPAWHSALKDPALLSEAQIQSLALELPYATSARPLQKEKRKKKKKKRQ